MNVSVGADSQHLVASLPVGIGGRTVARFGRWSYSTTTNRNTGARPRGAGEGRDPIVTPFASGEVGEGGCSRMVSLGQGLGVGLLIRCYEGSIALRRANRGIERTGRLDIPSITGSAHRVGEPVGCHVGDLL